MIIKHKFIVVLLALTFLCWGGVGLWSAFSGFQGSSVDPSYNNVFSAMSLDCNTDYNDGEAELPADSGKIDSVCIACPNRASLDGTVSVCRGLSGQWRDSLILVVTVAPGLDNDIATSYNDWQTISGFVTVNGNAVGHLEALGAAVNDNDIMKARNLSAFMAYYSVCFGSKNAVPLVIDSGADPVRVRNFFTALADYNDGYRVLFLNDCSPGREVFASSCIGLLLQYSGNSLLGRDVSGNLYFGRE